MSELINIGGINFTIDDDKTMVSYDANGYTYEIECGLFLHNRNAKQISVYPISYKTVGGVRDWDSKQELQPLSFSNKDLTKAGTPLYDSFFNMGNLSGTKIMRALINTYLESQHFINDAGAGQKAPCYDPLDDWAFKHPIEFMLASTPETGEGLNDGTITATIVKPDTGTFQIRYFRMDDTMVADYINDNVISGVTPDTYKVQLKNTDNNFESDKNEFIVTVEPFTAP